MKNVLLVDDDSISNFLCTKLLVRSGMAGEIHTAENGKQALELLNSCYAGKTSLPDVILLDLNMPVMDGFSFLEAFNRLEFPHKEKVSIVIVTSSRDDRDIARAKELGVTRYLTKPVTEESLRQALED